MSEEIVNRLMPRLRFPEFKHTEEWNNISIENVIEESRILSSLNNPNKRITVRLNQKGVEKREVRGTESEDATNLFIRHKGQFIYGKQNLHKGAFGIIPNELDGFESSQDIPAFEFKIGFHPQYFIYYLGQENVFTELEKISTGTGSKRIHPKDLFKVEFPFPSYLEQQKIADCLSSLDDLITAQKQKLEALKAHKKGLMQQLFPAEGETVPKLRFSEFKDSGDWEENVLTGEGVASFINEKITNNYLKLETYVSTENILPDYAGIMVASKLPAYGSFTKFQKGDILISNIRPYLKKVWFANTNGAASNDIIVIRADYKINPLFLSFLLKNDEFISFIMKSAEGVKMPRGDKDVIKEYSLTFPNQNEQQKIADCLSSLDKLITAQTEKIEVLKVHKKSLMQQLFPNNND